MVVLLVIIAKIIIINNNIIIIIVVNKDGENAEVWNRPVRNTEDMQACTLPLLVISN